MTCDRCGLETRISTGSYFDASTICVACSEEEQAHPDYEEARRIEGAAVRAGNYNHPGIGLPAELRERALFRADRSLGRLRFETVGTCWTGDCDCNRYHGLAVDPPTPPLHDGCVCVLARNPSSPRAPGR